MFIASAPVLILKKLLLIILFQHSYSVVWYVKITSAV